MNTVVAIIPAGVGLDAALAAMQALGACYPANTLSLSNDATGAMRVLYDPAAAAATTPAARIEVSLGVDTQQDLLRFAFSADDQQDALQAIALALIDMLNAADAANYLTVTVELPGTGRYALTIQRCDGATPAERIADLEAQLTAAATPGTPTP